MTFFDLQLKDKVVVVTGGAGSIGSALVQAFLQEGAKVVVCDVALEKNIFRDREFVDRNKNNLALLEVDLREKSARKLIISECLRCFARIDTIICNAAVFNFKPLYEWSDDYLDSFREHYTVGFMGRQIDRFFVSS